MSDIKTASEAQKVTDLLSGWKFNFGTEEELQEGIWIILKQESSGWEREYWLSKEDRIDFFHPESGIGIEAKIAHPLSHLTRQSHSYVQHDALNGLVIVTSKTRLTALPDRINGKPIRIVNLIGSIL